MSDRVGQWLGNYHLLQLLGRGGFADVYLGEHKFLKTQAAIKVLQAQMAQQDIQTFLREAQTIALLKHPHIVRILDFGIDNATPYLVMDFASHGTLRVHHPRSSIVPLTTIVSYVKQIASALQFAHDQKIVHRDVKPENMLAESNNTILLSDFGIAVAAHNTQSLSTQEAMGTVSYMAPEQIRRKARPASDQYSLAVVVYEWLTGTQPFVGFSLIEIAMKHLQDPPPSLREKVPTIPIEVEQVVLKALAKDPQQRFASVREFSEALEQSYRKVQLSLPRGTYKGQSKSVIETSVPSKGVSRDKLILPIHFFWIIDCCSSMNGYKIQELNIAIREAIPAMRDAAENNPNAKVLVRAVKFSTGATWQIAQPTPLESFQWVDLISGGKRDMGQALMLVAEQLKVPPMAQRGLPPVLVLVTDGCPSDDVNRGISAIMAEPWGKKAVRLAIGIGLDADYTTLEKFIANPEIPAFHAGNSEELVRYIKWTEETVEMHDAGAFHEQDIW